MTKKEKKYTEFMLEKFKIKRKVVRDLIEQGVDNIEKFEAVDRFLTEIILDLNKLCKSK